MKNVNIILEIKGRTNYDVIEDFFKERLLRDLNEKYPNAEEFTLLCKADYRGVEKFVRKLNRLDKRFAYQPTKRQIKLNYYEYLKTIIRELHSPIDEIVICFFTKKDDFDTIKAAHRLAMRPYVLFHHHDLIVQLNQEVMNQFQEKQGQN